MSVTVQLLQAPPVLPIEMASHAAKLCYNATTPTLGDKNMNVNIALFGPGHHTTLEHTNYTFVIEGIAVGDITLGFHLCFPFYNSDQRSGRYCTEMFENPDITGIARYIRAYYPGVSEQQIWQITDYVEACIATYNRYKAKAAVEAEKLLHKQRPHYAGDVAEQADKIAQEQMRVLIPVIMPTAFDFTVNLTTIVALYKSAFTPVMRAVTAMMADEVSKHDPRTRFMFVRDDMQDRPDWMGLSGLADEVGLVREPTCKLLDIDGAEHFVLPDESLRHPVDQLHFLPEAMNNSLGSVTTELTLSLMTMGQNQRHRTVHRGEPHFTGDFYLAPLLARCRGLREESKALAETWVALSRDLPPTLAAIIAPYGAVVKYQTKGDFNALIHEHEKRECWNAQEEVYNISTQLRRQIIKLLGKKSPLVAIFEPPCYSHGKCLEGKRRCGREINLRLGVGNYFPRRVI